jgi:hypothetical protein
VDVMHDIWCTTDTDPTMLIFAVDYRQVQAPQDNDAANVVRETFCLQVLARQLSSHRIFIARVKLQRIMAQKLLGLPIPNLRAATSSAGKGTARGRTIQRVGRAGMTAVRIG